MPTYNFTDHFYCHSLGLLADHHASEEEGSPLTEEQKKEKKRKSEAERRKKKKEKTEVERNNAAVLYVLGDAQFGRVKFDPTDDIHTRVDDDHTVGALADWIFESSKNRYDVLKLMLSLGMFAPDPSLSPMNISNPNLPTQLDQAAAAPNAPPPLVGIVDPNAAVHGAVELSRDALNQMTFDIQHQAMISGFLLYRGGGIPYFTTQSSMIKHGTNPKVIEWISKNFDVIYDGHDFSPYELNTLAEFMSFGEPPEYELPPNLPDVKTVDYYFGILGRISHVGGTGLYPPNSLNYLFSMKDRRDWLYKNFMLPNLYWTMPFDIPASDGVTPEILWDNVTWNDVAKFLWSLIVVRYKDLDNIYIPSEDFNETPGLVIKPTSFVCGGQGIAFLTPQKNASGEVITIVAKNIHDEVLLSPQAWFNDFKNSQTKFRVEPLIHAVRDKEYRFFFAFVKGSLTKLSCCRTKYSNDGSLVKYEHVGHYKIADFEPGYFFIDPEDNKKKVDSEVHDSFHFFNRHITGYPEKFKEAVQKVEEEQRAVFFVEGLAYRFDLCRYKLDDDKTVDMFLNEVTLCPPGDAFCYDGNAHWFVAVRLHDVFLRYMSVWWRKWPN